MHTITGTVGMPKDYIYNNNRTNMSKMRFALGYQSRSYILVYACAGGHFEQLPSGTTTASVGRTRDVCVVGVLLSLRRPFQAVWWR